MCGALGPGKTGIDLIELEHPTPVPPTQEQFRPISSGSISDTRLTQKPRRPALLRIDGAGTEKRPDINEADTPVGRSCFI